jgi:hypothetical protein
MEQENFMNPMEENKLPTSLNVLTILTFIGSAWELYSNTKNFLGGRKAVDAMAKAQDQLAQAPAFFKKLAGPEVYDMMEHAYENRVPLLIFALLGIGICVYGAIQMRKRKKEGYYLWLIGESLPILSSIVFLPSLFNTIYSFFFIIPLIFILLYTLQRKHLNN